MAILEVEHLNKSFERTRVLEDISFSLEKGQVLSIIGSSGSGKTTLLRCLNFLERPDGGVIRVGGETLFDELLAKEQPGYKERKKEIHEEIREEAKVLLGQMGLADRMENYPHQLSGGQCQRVAIARALALKPDILCFDEPTSALDPDLTGEVLKVIRSLADQETTMIIVTHEMAFARDVSSQVLFMDEGRILEQGTPQEVLENPREERTKQFLSRFTQG